MDKPEEAEQRAAEVAEGWLRHIDAGDADGSWAEASSTFRSAVTQATWSESLSKVQGSLGKPLARSLESAEYKSELPGAPDGHYVVLTYRTRFEQKMNGIETIVPELDFDGEWHVSGYFVK
jgi:hypothetical protein